MSRVAIVGTPFRCVLFMGDGEVEGLSATVFADPAAAALGTLTPDPSVDLPGLQTAYWTFDAEGTFYVRWSVEGSPEADVWQTVYVVTSAASYPVVLPSLRSPDEVSGALPSSVVAVGRAWYPEYVGSAAQTLTVTVHDPDLEVLDGTPENLVEYGAGRYRSASAVYPTTVGPHLIFVYGDQDTLIGYDVLDVFQPMATRTVSIGAKGMDEQGYAGVHVTMTSTDYPERTVMGYTAVNGTARFQLADGDYLITFRDPRFPGRTFTLNNFVFTVSEPTNDDTNAITYQLLWLDVLPIDDLRIPAQYRSVMHVRVLNGPGGAPPEYRTFTVDLLSPWRRGSLFVSTGARSYRLDQAGAADVPLIRGSRVRVSFPEADGTMTFTVPDSAEFNISDVHVDSPFAVTVPRVFYPMRSVP